MNSVNREVSNKLAEIIRKGTLTIFQRGVTNQTGVGATISVDTPQGRVQAYSYNVTQPGEVTVFYDTTNRRYVVWQDAEANPGNGGKLLSRTELQFRKTRPGGVKKYTYNFITLQNEGLLEGFNNDINLETEDFSLNDFIACGCCNNDGEKIALLSKDNRYIVFKDGEIISDITSPTVLYHLGYIYYFSRLSELDYPSSYGVDTVIDANPLTIDNTPLNIRPIQSRSSGYVEVLTYTYKHNDTPNNEITESTFEIVFTADSNTTHAIGGSSKIGAFYTNINTTSSVSGESTISSNSCVHPFTASKHIMRRSGSGSFSGSSSENYSAIFNTYAVVGLWITENHRYDNSREEEYSNSESFVKMYAVGKNCSLYLYQEREYDETTSFSGYTHRYIVYSGDFRPWDEYTNYDIVNDNFSGGDSILTEYINNILVLKINNNVYEVNNLKSNTIELRDSTVLITSDHSYSGEKGVYTFSDLINLTPIWGRNYTRTGIPGSESSSVNIEESTKDKINIGTEVNIFLRIGNDYFVNEGVVSGITKINDDTLLSDIETITITMTKDAVSSFVNIEPLLVQNFNKDVVITSKTNKNAFIAALYDAYQDYNGTTLNYGNLYTVEENDVITAELAFCEPVYDNVKIERYRADVYRFDVANLMWVRKANGTGIFTERTDYTPFISYHPNPISKKIKRF